MSPAPPGANINAMNTNTKNLPPNCRIALKEWAAFVAALQQGGQLLLLRKGGIREEGKKFLPAHPSFLLFPTYEHQKKDLLKPPFQANVELPANGAKPSTVTFTHWAKLHEAIEISEENALESISPFHIWSDDYAHKRLRWKPRQPLWLLILRVYSLGEPETVPNLPAYGGCKSWITLQEPVPLGDLTPVMSETEFNNAVAQIKKALDAAAILQASSLS